MQCNLCAVATDANLSFAPLRLDGSEQIRPQLAQLEDMVILVRGKLSNSARTTVGALTVIDVHARDVMIKLAYEKVAEK